MPKKNNNKKIAVAAGVAGAVLAGAAAVALSDKDNRKKLGKVAKDLAKKGQKVLSEVETNLKDAQGKRRKVKTQSKRIIKKAAKKATGK